MGNIEVVKNKVLPIVPYGKPILRRNCTEVTLEDYTIDDLVSGLWWTLDISGGVGLAAPQINIPQSIFIVNSTLMYRELDARDVGKYFSGDNGIDEVFINPRIIAFSEETSILTEGCLSIPGIDEDVPRSWEILIEYYDKKFKPQRRQFSGYTARVIQHEYDHLQGKLFIDRLSTLKKKLIKGRLNNIIKGKVTTNYPMIR